MNKRLSSIKLAEEFALASGYTATYDRMRLLEGFMAGWAARGQADAEVIKQSCTFGVNDGVRDYSVDMSEIVNTKIRELDETT